MVTTTGFDERVMTLGEAAGWLERRFGRRPNAASIWRWATKGIKGVRLATISLGRFRFTTEGALERFITETSLANAGEARHADNEMTAAPVLASPQFTKFEVAAARKRREDEKARAMTYLRSQITGRRPPSPKVLQEGDATEAALKNFDDRSATG